MARPRRSATERIEDAFSDLPSDRQSALLDDLQKLHRWCKRIRNGKEPEAEPEQGKLEETES